MTCSAWQKVRSEKGSSLHTCLLLWHVKSNEALNPCRKIVRPSREACQSHERAKSRMTMKCGVFGKNGMYLVERLFIKTCCSSHGVRCSANRPAL